MDLIVFAAVIAAAALHASWNAMVKHTGDKLLSVTAIVVGHSPLALIAMAWAPLPAPASWPYIAVGAALHVGYQMFLMNAYRIGDLTQVYPIARGVAPLIVAGVSVALLGVHLLPMEMAAILLIALGIMSLALVRGSDGLRNPRAAVLALITGCFIASYSLNDGLGARLAGTAVGFYGWLSLINAVVFAALISFHEPAIIGRLARQGGRIALIGGSASFVAYALVTWAFTKAPIALVTALRETSIVFALLIGVLFLKERLDLAKLFSTMVTLAGAALMRLAK